MLNPFNPSFGKVPEIFLDRSSLVLKIVAGLNNYNSPYQTTLISGVRGSGKTSLLTDISQTVAKQSDWIVVNLVSNDQIFQSLIESIYKQATPKLKKILDTIDGIKLSAFKSALGIEINTSQKYTTTSQVMLETILEKLKKENVHLLVTIDEVNSSPEIRDFASVYQVLIREELYISLIMTGLPEQISELQNDKVLTFLLRSKKVKLLPLKSLDIKSRYKKAFIKGKRSISDKVLNYMTLLTNGYAYAFQLLGYLIWGTNEKEITIEVVDSILDEYKDELYQNVYAKIYSELSEMDKTFVKAMVAYQFPTNSIDKKNIPISFIEKKMNKPHNYVAIYRKRLLDDQVIISPKRGSVQFTLPFFKEFVEENSIFFG